MMNLKRSNNTKISISLSDINNIFIDLKNKNKKVFFYLLNMVGKYFNYLFPLHLFI